MIEPILCDSNFNKIKSIDEYSSLLWVYRYYTTGDFEITLPATIDNINSIKENMYIIRGDDDNIGEIEQININTQEDTSDQLIVKGRFVSGSILDRRVISNQTDLYGKLSDVILKLLNENIIAPSNVDRKIENFITELPSLSQTINTQYTGQKLKEAIEELCEENKVGYKIVRKNNQWVFSLYEGLDRTYNQTNNIRCVFSNDLDNLKASSYTQDNTSVANSVYVAGEGEGINRVIREISNNRPTGMNRKELWLDKRDVSSNNGEISLQEYMILLGSIGLANIQQIPTELFNGDVYFDNIEYKKDVNVGDIVVLENKFWGQRTNVRLVEVIESVDESGTHRLIPTFDV